MLKKRIVIFGASGGIGSCIADALAKDHHIFTTRVDVSNDEAVVKYANRLKHIDIVIYSVGKINSQSIVDISIEDFKAIYETNFFGAVNVAKAFLPYMDKEGHFIFISSIRAIQDCKNRAAYCSSKTALDVFAKVLDKEVGQSVTIIRPGYVDTKLHKTKQLYPYSDTTGKKIKVLQPESVARSILFSMQNPGVKELNIGDVYGGKVGICFREE